MDKMRRLASIYTAQGTSVAILFILLHHGVEPYRRLILGRLQSTALEHAPSSMPSIVNRR